MQFLQIIWNGISGLGAGTIFLKALFILFLGAVFWMICELIKHMVNVIVKLVLNALRYLTIAVRGWPKNNKEDEGGEEGGKSFHR
jgi:hypothetical protein